MGDADGTKPHIGVAQHHALRPAGRTGRIENGREIVRIGLGRRHAIALRSYLALFRNTAGIGNIAVFQRAEPRFPGNEQPCAAIGEYMSDLRAFQQRIDGYMNTTGPGRRHWHQAGKSGLVQP